MRTFLAFSLVVVVASAACAAPKHPHRTAAKQKPSASAPASHEYHGLGQSQSLQTKNEDGTQLILNDHSSWVVDDADASMSSVWDSTAKLTIAKSDNAANPYTITNTATGDQVHASFSGYNTTTANASP